MKSSEPNLYSFGGACGTRGFWTQTAVSRVAELAETIKGLRDNPKCQKIYDSLKDLNQITSTYTPDSANGHRFSRLMTVGREISTLQSYLQLSGFKRGDALALLLDRTIEKRTLELENQVEHRAFITIGSNAKVDLGEAMVAAKSVEDRARLASQEGIQHLQKYFEALDESAECLTDNPALTGHALLNRTAQTFGAFASGDPASAVRVGAMMGGLSKLIREQKYNSVLRTMNDAQFTESIACMIEAVQYSYCAARDAQAVLDGGANKLSQHFESQDPQNNKNSPFYGYYLYTHQLPAVTNWLNTLRSTYTPRIKSDAEYVNHVFAIPMDFEIYKQRLMALYRESLNNLMQETDETARASQVLKMVTNIRNILNSAKFPRTTKIFEDDSSKVTKIPNFFMMNDTYITLPFRLIGIPKSDIPEECLRTFKPVSFTTWGRSTETGIRPIFFRTEFESIKDEITGDVETLDPIQKVISKQLAALIDQAQQAASKYYWDNLPIDISVVSLNAGIGQFKSAMSSLEVLRKFLLNSMEQLRRDDSADAKLALLSAKDTYERIIKVLDAYQVYSSTGSIDDGKNLIKVVHEEFNLTLMGSSFLSERLLRYIKRDLNQRLRSHTAGLSSLENDILIAANDLAYEQLVNSLGTNPGDTQSAHLQLATAKTMTSSVLTALDETFRDKIKAALAYYKNIATGTRDGSDSSIFLDSVQRSVNGSRILPRMNSIPYLDRVFNMALDDLEFVSVRSFIRRSWNPDLYPMPNPWRGPGYKDDEFGSNRTFWATLCSLVLALPNSDNYKEQCDGAELRSPFEKKSEKGSKTLGPLSLRYADWSKSFQEYDQSPGIPPSPSCAYYDISRRNQIYNMTLDYKHITETEGFAVPLPSESGLDERIFEFSLAVDNPTHQRSAVHAFIRKKLGKVPANTTYCTSGGMMAPTICAAYERRLAGRGSKLHGSVAIPCYDLKEQVFYCCNGTVLAGQLPTTADAPCYSSASDQSSLVKTLTDKDVLGQ